MIEIKEYNMDQQSDEWYNIRRMKLTSTGAKAIMAARGLGQTAETYAMKLISDELMETFDDDQPISYAMQHGHITEPIARAAYEAEKMIDVREVGFVTRGEFLGASPDGFVGDDGIIEIKSPQPGNHLKYLLEKGIPAEHVDQCQFQLYVSGRKWIDFITFNDYFKPEYQMKITRAELDPIWVAKFETRLVEFKALVNKIKVKMNGGI